MTRKNDKTFKNEEVYDYFEGEKESSPEQESEPKDILDDLRKIDKKEKAPQGSQNKLFFKFAVCKHKLLESFLLFLWCSHN